MKIEDYIRANSYKTGIRDAIDLDNIKIVLLDTKGMLPLREGLRNLLAIDTQTNIIWVADLPEGYLYTAYWTIEIRNNGLFALCGSFLCQIDIKTGKVISWQFVK